MDVIYLDNNATTRPAPEVVQAMLPYLTDWYGNPSSVHRLGQRSRQAIDEARAQVTSLINCSDSELLFTGGGTESINTAIRGLLNARAPKNKIITTTVEHSATRELCAQLAKEGAQIVEIEVDQKGALDFDQLTSAITDDTALVSILWANNETGVLFPVERIAALCKERHVPFHCDGTQAVGKIPVDVAHLGIDAMSFASHKFHGPKGVAALYIRRGVRLRPLIIGGPQERSRRGGTENVPGIVGMGKAAELAQQWLSMNTPENNGAATKPTELAPWVSPTQLAHMRDHLEKQILSTIPNSHVNGRTDQRVPNTTNIGFTRLEAEAILLLLSEQGLCASAGAACSSGSLEPSHVLQSMRIDPKTAHGAVRFSLSRYTTEQEITQALEILPKAITRLRAVLPVG